MTDTVLKPCPFCQKPPTISHLSFAVEVSCQNDDCPVNVEAYGKTEAEAATAWNTRADSALLAACRAALSWIGRGSKGWEDSEDIRRVHALVAAAIQQGESR